MNFFISIFILVSSHSYASADRLTFVNEAFTEQLALFTGSEIILTVESPMVNISIEDTSGRSRLSSLSLRLESGLLRSISFSYRGLASASLQHTFYQLELEHQAKPDFQNLYQGLLAEFLVEIEPKGSPTGHANLKNLFIRSLRGQPGLCRTSI